MQVFYQAMTWTSFCKVFFKPKATRSPSTMRMMNCLLDPAVNRFRQLEEDVRDEFRKTCSHFRNLYGFLSQIIPFQDCDLEKLYTYTRFLCIQAAHRATAGRSTTSTMKWRSSSTGFRKSVKVLLTWNRASKSR